MSDADVLSRPQAEAGPQPQAPAGAEPWTLAGQQLASRLILGTGGVQSLEVLRRVLAGEWPSPAMRQAGMVASPAAVAMLRRRAQDYGETGAPKP